MRNTMTCEEVKLRVADELGGTRLRAEEKGELEGHLADCAVCRSETLAVTAAWARMGLLAKEAPEPSPWMATRFYAALDAYQQGQRDQRDRMRQSRVSRWLNWWPSQPVWQMAASLGCLVVGLLTGAMIFGQKTAGIAGGAPTSDIAQLRKEMTGMRQLVTLSLLQQQSASERLRGVTWSYRAEPSDVEVLSALLRTAGSDTNVDVRLAAVEALRTFGDSPVARRGLLNTLARQDSPMVQIAIIDALVELKEKPAVPSLRAMLGAPGLDPNVRQRIDEALISLK